MEASVAAAGADGAQAQQDVTDGQGQAAQTPAVDAAAINDTLAQLASGQEELRNFIQSQPWAPASSDAGAAGEGGEGDGVPPVDLSFLDAASPNFDGENAGELLSKAIQDHVNAQVEAGVQKGIAPVSQQLQEQRTQQEANALVGEFPELGEESVAKQALDTTRQYVESMGFPAELAENMGMVRLVYMAARAADAAQQEATQTGAPVATLEGGAGARPGGSQGGITAQSIVGASRKGVLPFG